MKAKFSFMVLSTVLLLAACTDPASKWQIKTTYHINKYKMVDSVYTNDGNTTTFIYLPDGKLKESTLSNGNKVLYDPTKESTKTVDSTGKLITWNTWFKNNLGFQDSVVNYDAKGEVASSWKYTHDKNENRIRAQMYEHGNLSLIENKKYVNGMEISTEIEFTPLINPVITLNPATMKYDTMMMSITNPKTIDYNDFYPNRVNTPQYVNYLKQHWGEGSTQLKKTSVQISPKGDTLDIHHYHYTFDDKNRITSTVSESKRSQEYDSTSYTYY